jgi:hypothetical protein
MITTRAVPALLPAHHRRVATAPVSTRYDFADPLGSVRAMLIAKPVPGNALVAPARSRRACGP